MSPRYEWNREDLDRIPERPGLYTIYGFIPGDRMYHGQSNNLRARMLQHYRLGDIGFFPAYVTITIVPNAWKRDRLERERIERDRTRYNKQLKPPADW